MNEGDIKKQINNAQKPKEASPNKDNDSARRFVEQGIKESTNENTELLNDIFFASLKKIKLLSDADYVKYRAQVTKLDGYSARDVDRLTKVYKSDRVNAGDDTEEKQGRTSKTDMLLEMISPLCSFYHDSDFQVFVGFYVQHIDKETGEETGRHLEKWGLKSEGFKRWASSSFFDAYGIGLGESSFKDALPTIEGLGNKGEEIEVNMRYAFDDSGKVYIDLGRKNWDVVVIDTEGFRVIDSHNCPVHFIRSINSRPLPIPEPGGDINLLWKHINNESSDSKVLVKAWLLECMRVKTPYPVLEIIGQQGSAKSSMALRLKQLIDPHKGELISAPRGVEEMYRTAQGSHVVNYNNVSSLGAAYQDAMCQFSTGGADSVKRHYSNDEVVILEIKRPVIINGISHLVTRDDLADRVISLELPRISSSKRKTESELQKRWEKDYPLIIGGLYDLMSKSLSLLPKVKLKETPRMSDYAHLGQAMQNALGESESFVDIYARIRERTTFRIIEGSPVAQAILKLLNRNPDFAVKTNATYEKGKYIGNYVYLMELLESQKPKFFNKESYPHSPKGLADAIRRLTPALLTQNIKVSEKKRTKHGYHVELLKIDNARPKTDKEIEV